MRPVDFPQANKTFTGWDDILDLRAHDDGTNIFECWEFTKEDLEEVNRTGRIWISLMMRGVPPVSLQVESPFKVPRPMYVSSAIFDRVYVTFHDDMEVVTVVIQPQEYDFVIEADKNSGDGWFVVTVKNEGMGDERFYTEYQFKEELKVFGLASEHYGRFDSLAKKLNVPPDRLLILERINKTV